MTKKLTKLEADTLNELGDKTESYLKLLLDAGKIFSTNNNGGEFNALLGHFTEVFPSLQKILLGSRGVNAESFVVMEDLSDEQVRKMLGVK